MMHSSSEKKKLFDRLKKEYKQRDRYHFLSGLGEGGLAVVSSCFDKVLNRVVAVKELKRSKRNNPHLLRAFVTEAKLVSYLDHPGIVPIYDTFFERNNKLCYSMKLIEGMRLTSLLKYRSRGKGDTKGVPLSKLIEIFMKICETLAYVHDKGVIHLDIKPDNVLIGKYGEVFIMDWGNARLYNQKPYFEYFNQHMDDIKLANLEKEAEHMILGTPHYMSPEQTSKSRAELTPSSDIFSAGIILYQMLTGTHPFGHVDETREIMMEIRSFRPKPAHKVNSDIPLRVSMICEHMLEKDRRLRYHSFKEVLEDLDDFYNSGQAFETRTYKPGEAIVKEGDIGDYSFKILSGKVEVTKKSNGKKKVLAELGEDEIFGELAIFTKQPRTATVTALQTTTIRIMDRESVEKELEKLSPWVGYMITSLSNRFIEMNDKILKLEKE